MSQNKNLKPEQEEAITLDKNLLVSANAGSGKTFVMLERVVYAITQQNASILDFLLITFTDAAASGMRTKLQKKLIDKYNEKDLPFEKKEHLKKQISLISQADISTIHTFCYKLIKKYFYILNINASSKIADEEENKDLKEKAMQQTLDFFTKEEHSNFLNLMSSYDNKRNFSTIKDITFKIFNYLQNEACPENFKSKIKEIYSTNLEYSTITKVIDNYVVSSCDYFRSVFEKIGNEADKIGFLKLSDASCEVAKKLACINKEKGFKENLQNVFMLEFADKPRKTNDPLFDELSEFYAVKKNELTKELQKIKEKIYLSQDLDELQNNLVWCKDNIEMLLALEEKFEENFVNIKRERNVLDFSDLEHLAFKVLQNESINQEVSNHYKQIFVDEYQDVNDIQEGIITSIWKEDVNTLFLVGDPKQSIYRFRNTNPQIMMDKLEHFSALQENKKAINLKYNFRSDENILNFVNFVFSKIMTPYVAKIDYSKTGMFRAGIDFPKQDLPVVELDIISVLEDKKEKQIPDQIYSVKEAKLKEDDVLYSKSEAQVILSRIANLVDGKHQIYDVDTGMRPVEFKDIAILHRSRGEYIDSIISELKENNVPVKSVSDEKVLNHFEVQVLFNFLKLLENSQNDYALISFLTSPIINCSFNELAKLREKSEKPFFELCKENKDNYKKLERAFSLIDEGRTRLVNGTIYEVLNWLVNKTQYKSLIASLPDGKSKLINIQVYINDFLSHSYNNSLISYLSYVENNDNIKNNSQTSGEQNAITVVTMHQSKGLEYPIVFVVDMAHQFNKDSLKGPCLFSPNLGIGVQVFDKENRYKSSTLARSAIILEENDEEFAEQLRVMYVALTRAKNHLYIIGKAKLSSLDSDLSYYSLKRKQSYMSLLLSCLGGAEIEALKMGKQNLHIKSDKDTYFDVNVFEPIENLAQSTQKMQDTPQKLKYSDEILQNIEQNEQKTTFNKTNIAFKNSVSRIMESEDNRISYNYSPKTFSVSENAPKADEVGNAYHKAMEIIPLSLSSLEEVSAFLKENLDFDVFNLIDCGKIVKCLKYLQKWTSKAQKIIREGKFYLNIPYNQIVAKSKISNKVLIQGIVDFVVCTKDEVVLIDFKTTRQKNDDEMRKKYEIQMECYKIAVENALKRKVTSKILYSFFKDCEILFDK